MPTTRVPLYRCGTRLPGWLDGAHPTVEDGKIKRRVCFSDRKRRCEYLSPRLVVPHATVVQTECEANILSVVRRLTNRSVATCV